jgi:hypothetical protein
MLNKRVHSSDGIRSNSPPPTVVVRTKTVDTIDHAANLINHNNYLRRCITSNTQN